MSTIMDDMVMTMDGEAIMGGPVTSEAPVGIIKVTK